MFIETCRLALHTIRRNLLRSFLTVLGIVIGVASVIAMVTIGNGTTAEVSAKLSELGTNILFVRPSAPGADHRSGDAKQFNTGDVGAIQDQISGLRAAAPLAHASVNVIYRGQTRSVTAVGTTDDYLVAQNWTLKSGRDFLPTEERGGQANCLVGASLATALFGNFDPIGENIRVGTLSCSVIGVLTSRGQSGISDDPDDSVMLPILTLQRRIAGAPGISMIAISVFDGVVTAEVKTELEKLLRERRHILQGQPDDFVVTDMAQIAATFTKTTVLLTGLLASIAAISLFVGGIGIMNIMLVSVTERTREVGLRLAIGALETQVLTQFLVEAIVLSLFGGIVGICLGIFIAFTVVSLLGVPFVVSFNVIMIALIFSAVIGMGFGYFPARRAAMLNPIEALRHE